MGVLVELDGDGFMDMLGAGWAANSILVRRGGGGYGGGDVFGDGGGYDAAGNGATCDGSYGVVGFEEGYDTGGGEGVKGVRGDFVGGK